MMEKIGVKRKADPGVNKRRQISLKGQFYSNKKAISISNELISDENPLVGPPGVDAIVGAPTESIVSTCA
jgi:hypothetical protein